RLVARQPRIAVAVFQTLDRGGDEITGLDLDFALVVLELLDRDEALRFEARIDDDDVVIDADHFRGDELALAHFLARERFFEKRREILDARRGCCNLRGGSHEGWFLLHAVTRENPLSRTATGRLMKSAKSAPAKARTCGPLRELARTRAALNTAHVLQAMQSLALACTGPLAMKREYGIGHLGNRQIGRIEDHGVAGRYERRSRSRRIPGVALPDIAQKTVNGNRDSFCDQLLMPAFRALPGAGRQKNLQLRVRKNDRSHVAPLGNQARGRPERTLALHQRAPQPRMDGNARGDRRDLLGAQRIGDVAAAEHRAAADERDVEARREGRK